MPGMKSLSLPEVAGLLRRLPVKYRAICAIGVTTGCRITEILALRRFDLLKANGAWKEQVPFLHLKTRRKRGEAVRRRYMAIPAGWRPWIERHLLDEEQRGYDRPDDLVFRGKNGRPLSRLTVYRVFRQRLGDGYGTHWMRKTFAQEMFRYYLSRNRRDPMRALELTRQALGHARLDTTVRYLGIQFASVEEAQNAVFKPPVSGGERKS